MCNFKNSNTVQIVDHYTIKRGENKFILAFMLNKGEIQKFNKKQNLLTSYV